MRRCIIEVVADPPGQFRVLGFEQKTNLGRALRYISSLAGSLWGFHCDP